MAFIILAIILGVATGLLSLKFEKTFVAFFFALPACLFFAIKMFAPFSSIMAQTGEVGHGGFFSVIGYFYDKLPEPAQMAVILFPIVAIVSRIIGWIYLKTKDPAAAETPAERKKRILKEYGYENGLPY